MGGKIMRLWYSTHGASALSDALRAAIHSHEHATIVGALSRLYSIGLSRGYGDAYATVCFREWLMTSAY